MPDEAKLADLLDKWDEHRAAGTSLPVEVLCRDCPELAGEMHRRLQLFQSMDWLREDFDDAGDLSYTSAEETHSTAGQETKLPGSALTLEDFVAALAEAGLMPADEVQTLRRIAEEFQTTLDAESLACDLLAKEKLTTYQASVLLSGQDSPLKVGKYAILEVLGVGGMGQVFKAVDSSLDRVVALKMLPLDKLNSPVKVARFRREAKAAARLSHPNIAAAYDTDQADGQHFLVMEYVAGQDLAQHIKQHGPLPVERAVDYTLQAARALDHAHANGVVHRDVKPANLVLAPDGTVKLVDLGLAVIELDADDGAPSEHLTEAGAVMGTSSFMSPEQALDTSEADHRSDMYSLGVTLFYLLTGCSPFTEATRMKTLVAHREQPIPSLCEARADATPRLDAVFQRMLAKQPKDRYASMAELIVVLEAWRDPLTTSDRGGSSSSSRRVSRATMWLGCGAIAVAAVVAFSSPRVRKAMSGLVARAFVQGDASQVSTDLTERQPQAERIALPTVAEAPFDASTAGQHQRRWAEYLDAPLTSENSIGMQLILIPPGQFEMGRAAEEASQHIEGVRRTLGSINPAISDLIESEAPRHRVHITQAFYISRHEVTVAQFRAFADSTGYVTQAERADDTIGPGGFVSIDARSVQLPDVNWRNPGYAQTEEHPGVLVSWNDALAFSRWLSKQEGRTYALPTEAQWEYVCRAGDQAPWQPDFDQLSSEAHFNLVESDDVQPQITGSLLPNAFGVHDMLGNAREWCADWYDPAYYSNSPERSPSGPAQRVSGANGRVIRGGGLIDHPLVDLTPTFRYTAHPYRRYDNVGFRVVTVNDFPARLFASESSAVRAAQPVQN